MRKKYKLINYNQYKGKGRPKKSDYSYFRDKQSMLLVIIGVPIDPLKQPVLLNVI